MTKLRLLLTILSLGSSAICQDEVVQTKVFGRFGNACSHDSPCDEDANLDCQHGTCGCLMPDKMFYSDEALECRVKAGEKCRFTDEEMELEGLEGPTVMPCTPNATCSDDGTCRCNPYFYKDDSGRCLEKKMLGMPCDRNIECDLEAGLVCWEGKCGCNPTNSRPPLGYGPKNSCVGIPGGPCIQGECELNSKCIRGRCLCEDGFQLDHRQRRCRGMFDESCADNSFCGEQFDCIDFRCKCKGPNQVFDDGLQRCFSIVGEPCILDIDCVPHAKCAYKEPMGSLCQCDEGYAEFGPGFCRNGYGSPCLQRREERSYFVEKDSLLASSLTDLQRAVSEQVDHNGSLVQIKIAIRGCDENRKLRCHKGKCTCKDGVEMYSEKWGKCVGLAETLCSVYETHNCVENAECKPVLNLKHIGLGRCTCKENFSVGSRRHCVQTTFK